jgi:hypothetical protein
MMILVPLLKKGEKKGKVTLGQRFILDHFIFR